LAIQTKAKVVDLSENRHFGVPTVLTDHAACSRLAADHLKSCGLRNFAFVGIKNRPFSDRRRDAFLHEVAANCQVFELQDNEHALSSWGADHSAFIRWLKNLPQPVGIMGCYDLAGVRVLQSCNMAGIRIPDSVAVIGVNNDELQCSMTNPSMSSVIQNPERVGYEACHLLHRLMNEQEVPEKPLIIPPLGVAARRSTDILVIPDRLVVRAIGLIREYACEGLTVNEIAHQLNTSRRTLERRFMKCLGKTLREEIVNSQMKRACELLTMTRLTLAHVARQVGFNSVSHFTRLFTVQFGVGPNEFRKKIL
jgi:LacI family transcriptional regulator